MTLIYMIAVLGAVAVAKGAMECDLTQSTKAQQCFGELGEPLVFHLPTNATVKTSLRKNHENIFKSRGENLEFTSKDKNDSMFFQNGTFVVGKIIRSDSGDYRLQIHSCASGSLLQEISFHLEVLAPVSEPVVSQTCLSAEQMTVSCSAEGDEAEIILSLNNNELIKTRAEDLKPSNVTISLYGQLVGNLVCDVQNNVSKRQTNFSLTSCMGVGSHFCPLTVAVAVILTAVFHYLCFAGFLVFKYFKKKPHPNIVKGDDAEDDVVYSDVRLKRSTGQLHG